MDVDLLSDFLAQSCVQRGDALINRRSGRRIAAILPVHLLGGMADVDTICELSKRYDLPVIEDAAECLGATFRDRRIGETGIETSRKRLLITSFNGNKIVTILASTGTRL